MAARTLSRIGGAAAVPQSRESRIGCAGAVPQSLASRIAGAMP